MPEGGIKPSTKGERGSANPPPATPTKGRPLMHDAKHIIALILFGAGAVLAAFKVVHAAVACVSAGLFVEAW